MKVFSTLTGRFLALTIIFVMLAEVLIFVPSIARYRFDYLSARLERAQIASLSLLATPNDMIDPALEAELLENAEVMSIALRRDEIRELVLKSPMAGMVDGTFDLRDDGPVKLMLDAIRCMVAADGRIIRVIGVPVKSGGLEIEITMPEAPLKGAMLTYGWNIFLLSLLISIITAALLFLAVRRFMVRPMQAVVDNMVAFQESPGNVHAIIEPSASVAELRNAENALHEMQSRISASLKQKDRLAQLGEAVAKVSHDLRNMLTTAQLMVDRIDASKDPAVSRTAPKLVGSLNRAINLCEQTLTFGKAEEPAPTIRRLALRDIANEVVEAEQLRTTSGNSSISSTVPDDIYVDADGEQLFRVLVNLCRNARQAIENSGVTGTVRIAATQTDKDVFIDVTDTGPGLPQKALQHLFKPFEGGARRGGSGLGLAIASELVAGHGGRLELLSTSGEGTVFRVTLPQRSGAARDAGRSSVAAS